MKMNKILAAILAQTILVGCFALPVGAASAEEGYANNPKAEDKIATMESVFKNESYELFYQSYTGEIAIKKIATGEYFFSNPCDLEVIDPTDYDASKGDHTKASALLSQIILQYEDTLTGATSTMMSYTHAALAGGQIQFKNIENGVRVEYALGTVETKRLIPQWIESSRFHSQILDVLAARQKEFTSEELQTYMGIVNSEAYYKIVGPASEGAVYDPSVVASAENPDSIRFLVENPGAQMYYLLGIGERTKKKIEALIRKYVP